MGFTTDILFGAATSATQIEGGDLLHTWSEWHKIGNIHDDASPSRANDHLNKWKEDINLMKSMGLQVYRFGIEWARFWRSEGVINQASVRYYRELIIYVKDCGMIPLMTIHHFTNPLWFEEKGGFAKKENIPIFLRYVKHVINMLGDLVDEYITINEPNVFAVKGYFEGIFPPGEHSMKQALEVISNMAVCHIKAYKMIHKLRNAKGYKNTKVGFAHHVRVFEPKSANPWHQLCTRLVKHMFQDIVSKAFYLGRFVFPLKSTSKVHFGYYSEFIAINYYSRSTVSGFADGVRKNAPVNDLGWEIYPEGIVKCAKELYKIIPRPIYITENGTCDNNDSFRCRYIYEHVKALSDSGLPIKRYYHWCFCDNFEWAEGESARFGLVHVDFETQEREIKRSGRFYSEMIKNNGVTDKMYDEYVKPQKYHK